ncbi:MAG: serine/threonine-protein kinase, partial [Proteobacteria bacterium]|nr:serine/threonine-protein kinase [Pseudomonadota bacterium]
MRTTLPGTAVGRPRAKRTTLIGAVIAGRYEVTARLAAGGFGAIYRALDRTTGLPVALKIMHAALASDPSLAARFRREGELHAMLRDPRTVALHGVGEDTDGTLYLVLELLHGETLEQRLAARGPLPWRDVLVILREVCRALGEAHALAIVHRDLKPGNVFLSTSGVKVIDFGVAKLTTT